MGKSIYSIVFLLTCLLQAPGLAGDDEGPLDIIVVANKSVPRDRITLEELRDIFLRNKTRWGLNIKAVPIHAPARSQLRDLFTTKVLGMSPNAERLFFEKQKIQGGHAMPSAFPNTQKAVYSVKGSIGYVFRENHLSRVNKVLLVVR